MARESAFRSKIEMEDQKKVEELIKEYELYAREKGFKLNPKKEILEMIIRGLIKNEESHGKRFCPCRRVTGVAQIDTKNICPCFFHEEEIKKTGHCLCNLFFKKE